MTISKNKKVKFAIVAGLLILIVAGLWIWRFKFKSFADDLPATSKVFAYQIDKVSSKYFYSPNIIINTVKKEKLITVIPVTSQTISSIVINSIDNFKDLGEMAVFKNNSSKTPTALFSQYPDSTSISGILNNKKSSFDSSNYIWSDLSSLKPIIIKMDPQLISNPQFIPANAIIKNVSVNIVQKCSYSSSCNTYTSVSNNVTNVTKAVSGNLTSSLFSNAPTKISVDNYTYTYSSNYDVNGNPKAWAVADLANLYIGVAPQPHADSNHKISSIRLTVEYSATDGANNSGMLALSSKNLDKYNSKNDLTQWKQVNINKIQGNFPEDLSHKFVKIQWFAGSFETVTADLANAQTNNDFLGDKTNPCKSSCSKPINITNQDGKSFSASLQNFNGTSPVGRYGAFFIKFWSVDGTIVPPVMGSNLFVSAYVPITFCPKITAVPSRGIAGRDFTVKGTGFGPNDKVYFQLNTNKKDKYYLENSVVTGSTSITGKIPSKLKENDYFAYVEADCGVVASTSITSILPAGQSTCPENITAINYAYEKNSTNLLPMTLNLSGQKFGLNNNVYLKNIVTGVIKPVLLTKYNSEISLDTTLASNTPDGEYELYVQDSNDTCGESIKLDKTIKVSTLSACPSDITLSNYYYYKDLKKPTDLTLNVLGNKFSNTNTIYLQNVANKNIKIQIPITTIGNNTFTIVLKSGSVPVSEYNLFVSDQTPACKNVAVADKPLVVSSVLPPACPTIAGLNKTIVTNAKIVKKDSDDKGTLVTIIGKDFGKQIGTLELIPVNNIGKELPVAITPILWSDTKIQLNIPLVKTDWNKIKTPGVDKFNAVDFVANNPELVGNPKYTNILDKLKYTLSSNSLNLAGTNITPWVREKDYYLKITKPGMTECSLAQTVVKYVRFELAATRTIGFVSIPIIFDVPFKID